MLDSKSFKQAFVRLVAFAMKHEKVTMDDARDLAQHALRRLIEAGDVTDVDPLVQRGTSLIRQKAHDDRRAEARRRRPEWLRALVQMRSSPADNPERQTSAKERSEKLFGELFARAHDDPQVHGLVNAMLDGNSEPVEQAAALGLSERDLRNARKRLLRTVRDIAERHGGVAVWAHVDPLEYVVRLRDASEDPSETREDRQPSERDEVES
jgi:hypothetical protein